MTGPPNAGPRLADDRDRPHRDAAHLRARLARDIYAYLHIPVVLGIVLVALGIKKTLEHADQPLDLVVATALGTRVALIFLSVAGIRLRRGVRPGLPCTLAILGALASVALAPRIASLATLALLGVLATAAAVVMHTEAWSRMPAHP